MMNETDLRELSRSTYPHCGRQSPGADPIDWARNLWVVDFMHIKTVQFHVDFLVWERILEANPDLKGIIELGSLYGGLSLFLALQAYQRGQEFATFDHVVSPAADTPLGKLIDLRKNSYAGDLFNGVARTGLKVRELLKTWAHPIIFLCDDGDKPREFKEYAPLLTPGDIIGTHDWMNECGPDDIKPVESYVEPYYHAECEAMGSLTRFWKRKAV
jgi:cephalosporin hydroxylase